jgi:hypothetical protein
MMSDINLMLWTWCFRKGGYMYDKEEITVGEQLNKLLGGGGGG